VLIDRSVTYLIAVKLEILACILFPDSLPQACRGSLGMNYEVSLLVSLTAATEMS